MMDCNLAKSDLQVSLKSGRAGLLELSLLREIHEKRFKETMDLLHRRDGLKNVASNSENVSEPDTKTGNGTNDACSSDDDVFPDRASPAGSSFLQRSRRQIRFSSGQRWSIGSIGPKPRDSIDRRIATSVNPGGDNHRVIRNQSEIILRPSEITDRLFGVNRRSTEVIDRSQEIAGRQRRTMKKSEKKHTDELSDEFEQTLIYRGMKIEFPSPLHAVMSQYRCIQTNSPPSLPTSIPETSPELALLKNATNSAGKESITDIACTGNAILGVACETGSRYKEQLFPAVGTESLSPSINFFETPNESPIEQYRLLDNSCLVFHCMPPATPVMSYADETYLISRTTRLEVDSNNYQNARVKSKPLNIDMKRNHSSHSRIRLSSIESLKSSYGSCTEEGYFSSGETSASSENTQTELLHPRSKTASGLSKQASDASDLTDYSDYENDDALETSSVMASNQSSSCNIYLSEMSELQETVL